MTLFVVLHRWRYRLGPAFVFRRKTDGRSVRSSGGDATRPSRSSWFRWHRPISRPRVEASHGEPGAAGTDDDPTRAAVSVPPDGNLLGSHRHDDQCSRHVFHNETDPDRPPWPHVAPLLRSMLAPITGMLTGLCPRKWMWWTCTCGLSVSRSTVMNTGAWRRWRCWPTPTHGTVCSERSIMRGCPGRGDTGMCVF